MVSGKLTDKQETYCQNYVICGNQSAAYRIAYDAEDMNSESVHVAACRLHSDANVSLRIRALQLEAYKRNNITINELVSDLADMVRFDVGDLYDDNGNLLPIKQMPATGRKLISQFEVDEIYKQGFVLGVTKKVKILNKLDALEKLAKHLGLYEKDNFQKKTEINIVSSMSTEELISRAKALKDISNAGA